MAVELADIFHRYGPAYRQKYASRMPATHLKAMWAVEQCRTEALGGQVYRCPNCEQVQYSYHSCRNRHCPKCQTENAQRWLNKQQDLLLPVPYFLLTFTLPASFNQVARSHQKLLYDLLFKTSAAATQQLAQELRWIGGQIGMVGVLHTWGRNLAYHPHIHYLVPAGALTVEEKSGCPHARTSCCRCEPSPEFSGANCVRLCGTPIVIHVFRPRFGSRSGSCTVKRLALA